jgi:hypothetical protein
MKDHPIPGRKRRRRHGEHCTVQDYLSRHDLVTYPEGAMSAEPKKLSRYPEGPMLAEPSENCYATIFVSSKTKKWKNSSNKLFLLYKMTVVEVIVTKQRYSSVVNRLERGSRAFWFLSSISMRLPRRLPLITMSCCDSLFVALTLTLTLTTVQVWIR